MLKYISVRITVVIVVIIAVDLVALPKERSFLSVISKVIVAQIPKWMRRRDEVVGSSLMPSVNG